MTTAPNILAGASNWLADMVARHASSPVVYSRGLDRIALNAASGKTPFEQTNADGIMTQFVSRDFIVKASDLCLGGGEILPAPGDRIEETVGATTRVFEVLSLAGAPHYTLAGAMIRIHTKQVE